MSSNKRTRTICFYSNRVAIQRESIFKWFYIYNLLILNCQNSRCWDRFVCLGGFVCLFLFRFVFLKRKGYYVLNFLQYIFPEGPGCAGAGRLHNWLQPAGSGFSRPGQPWTLLTEAAPAPANTSNPHPVRLPVIFSFIVNKKATFSFFRD